MILANPGLPLTRFGLNSRRKQVAMTPTMADRGSGVGRLASRPVLFVVALALGALAAAAGALWAHYGTAVFYEMILAGINACF